MENKSFDKKISLLDWFIIFAIIIMFIMVYVPQSIWREEAEYKADRRNRMEILSNAGIIISLLVSIEISIDG